MADVSAEPSMEEILSSIKRIIAEEEGVPARRRVPVRSAALPDEADEDEGVLELSQPFQPDEPAPPIAAQPAVVTPAAAQPIAAAPVAAPAPVPVQEFVPPPAVSPVPQAPAQVQAPAPASVPTQAAVQPQVQGTTAGPASEAASAETIVSARAADATRGSLESLSRMIVRPSSSGAEETLEGLVRELLKPMLREWLDAKLPGMVETLVSREIARITGRDA